MGLEKWLLEETVLECKDSYTLLTRLGSFVMLCGVDKGSQKRDIQRALRLASDWRQS